MLTQFFGCPHPAINALNGETSVYEVDEDQSRGSFGEKQRSRPLATQCHDKPLACRNESCERGKFR